MLPLIHYAGPTRKIVWKAGKWVLAGGAFLLGSK
jgi:hypothetical protein